MIRSFRFAAASRRTLLLLTPLALGLISCDKDDDKPAASGTYRTGAFILNEGSGGTCSGVSFVNRTGIAKPEDDIYLAANGQRIGDIPQGLTVIGDRAYLVVNNSNKIEVVNADTYRRQTTIGGLTLPRYLAAVSATKAYVTEVKAYDGNPGQVRVLDLTTNALGAAIGVGVQPEQLVPVANRVFVSNWGDNTVSVLDPATDALTATIVVGGAPRSMVLDADQKLWVLCGGKVYNSDASTNIVKTTEPRLVRLNPATAAIEQTIALNLLTAPDRLQLSPDGRTLYFVAAEGLFQLPLTATTAPTTPLVRRAFYGFGVDPTDGTLYGADARDYQSNGRVIRYAPSGAVRDSFSVGVNPGGVFFR